jgi:hypothetical protein
LKDAAHCQGRRANYCIGGRRVRGDYCPCRKQRVSCAGDSPCKHLSNSGKDLSRFFQWNAPLSRYSKTSCSSGWAKNIPSAASSAAQIAPIQAAGATSPRGIVGGLNNRGIRTGQRAWSAGWHSSPRSRETGRWCVFCSGLPLGGLGLRRKNLYFCPGAEYCRRSGRVLKHPAAPCHTHRDHRRA